MRSQTKNQYKKHNGIDNLLVLMSVNYCRNQNFPQTTVHLSTNNPPYTVNYPEFSGSIAVYTAYNYFQLQGWDRPVQGF